MTYKKGAQVNYTCKGKVFKTEEEARLYASVIRQTARQVVSVTETNKAVNSRFQLMDL